MYSTSHILKNWPIVTTILAHSTLQAEMEQHLLECESLESVGVGVSLESVGIRLEYVGVGVELGLGLESVGVGVGVGMESVGVGVGVRVGLESVGVGVGVGLESVGIGVGVGLESVGIRVGVGLESVGVGVGMESVGKEIRWQVSNWSTYLPTYRFGSSIRCVRNCRLCDLSRHSGILRDVDVVRVTCSQIKNNLFSWDNDFRDNTTDCNNLRREQQ